MKVSDVDLFRRDFTRVECEMFQLFSMLERPLRLQGVEVLRALDRFFLRQWPYLKRHCRWMAIFVEKST
jgi:hypothetical protein